MQEVRLSGMIREESGKKVAHKLRKTGEIPGILYGHKEDPVPISVKEHELWLILHNAASEHLILKLVIADSDVGEVMTLVRDVQHHPVTGDILHIDLQRISMDEEIKVGVPVELVGVARGVKEFGGVLDHGVREVMLRTTPAEVPECLEIDVSSMEIGHTIHISNLVGKYPQLDFLDDPGISLAHISPPKKLELAEELEAAEAAAAEEAVEGEGAEEGAAEDGKES